MTCGVNWGIESAVISVCSVVVFESFGQSNVIPAQAGIQALVTRHPISHEFAFRIGTEDDVTTSCAPPQR